MGVSYPPIREFVTKYIIDYITFSSVLDLGAGFGLYGKALKELKDDIYLIGVEKFISYSTNEKSWLLNYDEVYIDDLQNYIEAYTLSDVVLIMDVIEHFTKEDAIQIINKLKDFKHFFLSTPLFNYKQGIENGNELEIHKCWFNEEELNDLGLKCIVKEYFNGKENKGDIGAFTVC